MKDIKTIDPRIKLILLPGAGFVGFFIKDTILLSALLFFALCLYLYSGMYRQALRFLLLFAILISSEFGLGYLNNHNFVFGIYMILYFVLRMTLIAMFGSYVTKTTSVSEMLEALNRMKIPRCVSVPFSVLLRFAPTMRQEMKALKENMRMRGVIGSKFFVFFHPFRYMEYTLVPLLMRMIKVADELSASALIRGLDSEEERVTLTELSMRKIDLFVMFLGMFDMALVLIVQQKI